MVGNQSRPLMMGVMWMTEQGREYEQKDDGGPIVGGQNVIRI